MYRLLQPLAQWLFRPWALLAMLSFTTAAQPISTSWMTDPNHPPVSVRFVLTGQIDSDTQQLAGYLDVKLEQPWKTYWRSPGEGGVAPEINWQGSTNLDTVDWHWPFPQRFSVLGIETLGYRGDTIFPITLRVHDLTAPVELKANLSLSSCSTVCVINDYPFMLAFTPTELSPEPDAMRRFAEAMSRVPQADASMTDVSAVWDSSAQQLELTLNRSTGWSLPVVLVDGQSAAVVDSSFIHPKTQVDGQMLRVTYDVTHWLGQADLSGERVDVTISDQNYLSEISLNVTDGTISPQAQWPLVTMLLMALIGGLILNLMPCVLPVLGMKLASIVNTPHRERRKVRAQFLASSAGIISAFWMIALGLMILKASGEAVGWGIQFQSDGFLALMLLVTTLFGANMLGLFELRLPSTLNTWLAARGGNGYVGHYVQGLFATLLATPCSAPFLGTAVAFALAADNVTLWVIFSGLGVGFALPWLIIALFPSLATKLPAPGQWMNRTKLLFGAMMLATTVWLATLLTAHWPTWGIFAYLLMAALLLLWRGARVYGGRQIGIVACVSLLGLSAVLVVGSLTAEKWSTPLPQELSWQPLNATIIDESAAQGKVVFVDVTAEWCITCKANKIGVLLQQPVYQALQDDDVVRVRGDWSLPNASVTQYLQQNGRFGVPFNIVYGPGAPDGIALPVILSDRAVMEAIQQARGEQG
ncbi:thioredoxin family protein [Vibrio fluvialis]|uniref:protein-disulfide reductase DsbD family protein n=1 Tax=Vibrio fluvialis TaxID=676 RepID=UPI001ABE8BE7|nr:protein-disulfide reductase DsbD domain-containing protein [Vibrio fluvialis]MBY7767578.1 thioredoxin family protein [Vibrio fluvialis]MBY8041037.1 thioredoxin family protein [Vibrio fluvialis]MBY8050113.1 thioredoxin family protein [Vibrio fluvialis]QTH09954.1 thioredoxin family protein [Vibrio fluvialis]